MKKLIISMSLALTAGTQPALAYEKGDWLLRAGLTTVAPDDSSSNVMVGGADLGVGVNVNSNTQVGLNLVYFLSSRCSVELLAAAPFSHDIGLDTVGKLGNSKHLPPTLSANYYINGTGSALQPYVGLGLNYTFFFDETFSDANSDGGFSKLELDNSFGLAAQLGADYRINDNWQVNGSLRWIDIDSQAEFELNGTKGQVDVSIDPLVYTLSLGYRF